MAETASEMLIERPQVTYAGGLDLQVCVPAYWSDPKVYRFAEQECPCGTELGWVIRRQGSPLLAGAEERVPCRQRPGFVHIMLDA